MTETGGGVGLAAAPPTKKLVCPLCGWTGTFDARFTAWCEQCGYNADPQRKPAADRAARRREKREAKGRARELAAFEALRTAPDLRPGSGSTVLAAAISVFVHLITLAVLGGTLWAFTAMNGIWARWVVLVLGLAIAFEARPRVWTVLRLTPKGRRERAAQAAYFGRDVAPNLFALLDRCADAVQAPRVDIVAFSARFNASTWRFGLRRRVRLELGVPLWAVLDRDERLALLGHELGHQMNGDFNRTVLGWTAARSLHAWAILFDPRMARGERRMRALGTKSGAGITALLGEMIAPVLMAVLFSPLYAVIWCLRWLQRRLDLAGGQRAEYLADEVSARLASSAAAGGVMRKIALSESVFFYVRKQRSAHGRAEELWPGLAAYLDSVPDHEKRRRVYLQKEQGTRIDSTHPATFLRAELLAARPQREAAVTVSEQEWAAIDAELAGRYAAAARSLLA